MNTHAVDGPAAKILRGMLPRTQAEILELKQHGVTDILIFRAEHPGEVGNQKEAAQLKENGFSEQQIHLIPFQWKEKVSFREACSQTIEGLNLLKEKVTAPGKGIFFHCTVGEDRTGYLAGLYKIAFQNADPRETFQNDLCAHGYAEANPEKPEAVAKIIHQNLTPLFFKMAQVLKTKSHSKKPLSLTLCESDPSEQPGPFKEELAQIVLASKCATLPIDKKTR